jgi:hypothetical protein
LRGLLVPRQEAPRMIRGIYKIPQIRHAFFIVDSLSGIEESPATSLSLEEGAEYFEHILQLKDHICPKEAQQWKLRVVSSEQFLRVLEKCTPKELGFPNQSSCNPEYLELLAINLVKTPLSTPESLYSSKKLGVLPDEDVIEVFI